MVVSMTFQDKVKSAKLDVMVFQINQRAHKNFMLSLINYSKCAAPCYMHQCLPSLDCSKTYKNRMNN